MTSAMTTIIDRPEDLKAALDAARGDAVFLLRPSADPYQMNIWYGLDSGGRIEIRALDPENPPVFSRILLRDSKNFTFDGIKFYSDNTDRPSYMKDINIDKSSGIHLLNVVGESVGVEFYDPATESVRGNSFLRAVQSSDIVIENVKISNYFDGFSFQNVNGLIFRGNTIEKIQNDGLHGGQFVDAVIENNVFRDFLGVEGTFRHSDMIQVWSDNAKAPTQNLIIRDNLFLSNGNVSNQTIFIQNRIKNNEYDKFYKDILIENNIIYNGGTNAIYIDASDGVRILNNTLIWDQIARSWAAGEAKNGAPKIWVRPSATDVLVDGNVMAVPLSYEPGTPGLNVVVSYDGSASPFDVDAVFVGARGATDLASLALRPDGPLGGGGFGARASIFDPEPDRLTPVFSARVVDGVETRLVFDAQLSSGPDGPLDPTQTQFLWRMPDGTTRSGAVVAHDLGGEGVSAVTLEVIDARGASATTTRYIDVPQSLRYELSFGDSGPFDSSSFELGFQSMTPTAMIETELGPAYRITKASPLGLGNRDPHLNNLDQFAIALDIRPDALTDARQTLVFLNGGLDMRLRGDGELEILLETDAGGEIALATEGAGLKAEQWAHIVLSYDSHAGRLAAFVDGAAVGSIEARGLLTHAGGANWVVGHPWGRGVEGVVRGFSIHDDPLDAQAARDAYLKARAAPGFPDGGSGGAPTEEDGSADEGDAVADAPLAEAQLVGGDGDDVLTLKPWAASASGGDGADIFRIDARGMPAGAVLVIHDFDPHEGDAIAFRHFGEGFFSDETDPDNALTVNYGGRHADADSFADLREIAAGASAAAIDEDGMTVLRFAVEGGFFDVALNGISHELLV